MSSDCIHELNTPADERPCEKLGSSEDTHLGNPVTEQGKNETFSSPLPHLPKASSPETTRDQLYRYAVYDDLKSLHSLSYRPIPSWKDKKLVEQLRGSLTLSRELRAAFSVLNDLRIHFPEDCEIAAVMVNFNERTARKLIDEKPDTSMSKSKRTTAGRYELLINKRMRDHGVPAAWFCVIGRERNPERKDFFTNPYSGLHVHCIVAYDKADKKTLKKIFAKDKSPARNSMGWATEFEGGPINVGAADYLSKHIYQACSFMPKGRNRLYVSNSLRAAAKMSYEQRVGLFKAVEKNSSIYTDMSLQSILFLHQHFPDLF